MRHTPVCVFGIPIEGFSLADTLHDIQDATHPMWIVTANPEILLAAKRDPAYAETLQKADVRLVDGFGLWALLRVCGYKTQRVTGVECAEALIQFCVQNNLKVACIGGASEIAAKAAEALQRMYPSLRIFGDRGGRVARDGSVDVFGEEAIARLIRIAPDILLVAFGHPKQERWIERHLKEFPSVKVVVGIGGTLNYWAGTIHRAPRWMRSIGLEWVWRLLCEPSRLKRIVDAVIVFSWYFLMEQLTRRVSRRV